MNFLLRPARSTDAGSLAAMMTAAVAENPWKPRLHTGAEDIAFVGHMIDRGWVTVAEDLEEQRPLGFLAQDGAEVNALFVALSARNKGVGRALLDNAKTTSDTLTLWTFEANTGAQRFYRREGFTEVRRTDGRDNDEGLPDVLFRWQKPTMKSAPDPAEKAQP
ncbi:GNAT family N-acetyltransferase [Puniceibacterium sediminis]|uniref:Ribosomal protein S18 acetylase RimI n=1 Tax=Puniceibacterium sediminis TaxID=1608407 RepID=A0A238XW45_9RHOB|nr:GNAT family N-acetyltransferase [Puniceibacterium sediminis]SNR63276.1 Ribosomal protein S18 acetylase RimI [Puniceibacterium sediminis]